MPISKRAGERIRVIDKCLQDKSIRYWSFEKLEKYIKNELTLESISERSIRGDIKNMKEAYGAPINKAPNKGWYYTDDDFSIYKDKFSADDLELLQSASGILNQFKGLRNFEEIAMLADKVDDAILKTEAEYVVMDVNNRVEGLKYADKIIRAIKNKKTLKITYLPFNYLSAEELNICAYQLKEYNNRWFMLAKTIEKPEMEVGIYALDRIQSIKQSTQKYIPVKKEVVRNFFKDVIGVSNFPDKKVETIVLEVFGYQAKYIKTKPWHHSQKIIRESETSTTFELSLKINYELESLILGFGSNILVKAPLSLRDSISEKLKIALGRY
jgi:predicted DNA-binding transcriptional regulator YafY